MTYCTKCGTKLINEENIPFCPTCDDFRFPTYNVAVSIITVDNVKKKILLIKQYGKDDFTLVAAYVNKGEDPEQTVVRKLKEETGLITDEVFYNSSGYFQPGNTLMLNYICTVRDSQRLSLNKDVDDSEWFDFAEVKENIKANSLAQKFLLEYLDKRKKKQLCWNDWYLKI